MIIQCNSCDKKFTVADSAITKNGRLVQCSACGNKWTQYPVNVSSQKATKTSKTSKPAKKTNKVKKVIDTYSEEYLQKKHGIKIIDPSSLSPRSNKNKSKNQKIKKINASFGFYNYLITIVIILLTLFGLLNLTKDIVIYHYPFFENYISHLYETLNNFNLIISDIISNY